jgi:hypothetical protein
LPSIFDPSKDPQRPALHAGTVVARYSRSKGFLFLYRSEDPYESDNSCRTWSLSPEVERESIQQPLHPAEIIAKSGLTDPYFLCWHLQYDPKEQKTFYLSKERWRGIAPHLRWMLEQGTAKACPTNLKPGHYIEVTIESDAPRWETLGSRTVPYVNPLRPSEMLALLLFIYGDLSIGAASRGSGLAETSIKSAAAALTRKGLIQPVGRGTVIKPNDSKALKDFLRERADRAPWLAALLMTTSAAEALKARRAATA